jgi:hypothetical protein
MRNVPALPEENIKIYGYIPLPHNLNQRKYFQNSAHARFQMAMSVPTPHACMKFLRRLETSVIFVDIFS